MEGKVRLRTVTLYKSTISPKNTLYNIKVTQVCQHYKTLVTHLGRVEMSLELSLRTVSYTHLDVYKRQTNTEN